MRFSGAISTPRRLLSLILFSLTLRLALSAQPNVILVTVDTTRADRMGFLGSQRGLTPNLDRLARGSVIFSAAYANVPLTTPSHAGILTGTYPQFNHLADLGDALANQVPFLPDILHRHGYHTAAFVGSQVLDPKGVAVPGFDRGFETYDAGFHQRQPGEDRYHSVERRATVVVERALAWLDGHRHEPFFLWVHLYDPHEPYDPPRPFAGKFSNSPYDGEIAYVDSAVGDLLDALRSRGLYERSLIAMVGDHGEAFGEHGEQSHGFFLYDETLHVPLLMKLPAGRMGGKRVETTVGLVDIAPTILKEVRVAVPPEMQGSPLQSLMVPKIHEGVKNRVASGSGRPQYSETDYPRRAFGWSSLRALRSGGYLYIDAPKPELYDQIADPKSVHNLASSLTAVADTMAAQLAKFRLRTSSAIVHPAVSSGELSEQLRALGYIRSPTGQPESPDEALGSDPKDKIAIANLFHQALLAMEEEHYSDAIQPLKCVLAQEPNLGLANLELGRAWMGLDHYEKAVPWLRNATRMMPESGQSHLELGIAFAETDNWVEAAPQFEAALAKAPDSEEMYYALATAYEKLGRTEDASQAYRNALRLNPNDYRANLFFGRLLGMNDDPESALSYLRQAVKLQPASPDAHKFLANVYVELGQTESASRERAEAERLQTKP